MVIETRFWGSLDIQEDAVVHLAQEILGFPGLTRWVLLPGSPNSPFLYLQSVEEREVAFVAIDPLVVVPNYAIPEEDGQEFGPQEEWAVLCLCTISKERQEALVNLRSPIIVNQRSRQGGQVILSVPYPFQHPLTSEAN